MISLYRWMYAAAFVVAGALLHVPWAAVCVAGLLIVCETLHSFAGSANEQKKFSSFDRKQQAADKNISELARELRETRNELSQISMKQAWPR